MGSNKRSTHGADALRAFVFARYDIDPRPPSRLSALMGVPGDDGWTLDLLVRGGDTPSIVSVHGEGANLDVIELEGTVASLPDNMVLPLAISLSDLDSQRFDVQEQGGGNWVFLADGEPTNTAIRSFQATPAIDGHYMIYSGVLANPTGSVDFVAVADPLPFVVIAGAVAVGGCLAFLAGTVILKQLEARISGFVKKCREQGGIPEVKVRSRLRVRLGEFSCNPEPELICRDLAGNPIASQFGALSDLEIAEAVEGSLVEPEEGEPA